MSPVIYQLYGVLQDGKYLPGQPFWPSAKQLSQVLVNGQRPTSGTLKLYLEIGGFQTDFFINVPSGDSSFTISRNLQAMVPANQKVRWLASFDGAPEDAASNITLTLALVPAGVVGNQLLTVRDGGSGIVYYGYDPDTHQFINAVPAGITPAWVINQAGDSSITISFAGQVVMDVASETVSILSLIARGGTQTVQTPRAVFYINNVPIATVTADAVMVADVTEASPEVLSSLDGDFGYRFEFWSGGVLTATLDGTGLTAADVVEAVSP